MPQRLCNDDDDDDDEDDLTDNASLLMARACHRYILECT